jgi:hypothetical protein
MSFDLETIYGLLPAVYRVRDAAVAEQLDGLLTPAEAADFQALRDALAAGTALDEEQQRRLAALEEKRLRGPLKALLTVIAEQVAAIEENIEQLYDDQFIETCAEWVVPYIADLIGYRQLDPRLQRRVGSTRSEVANTIRYRRRKGTAAMLEQLAVDITSWDAAVVEFFRRLATTQYLNHPRPDHHTTPDLRRVDALEAIGTPFDRVPRTAEVRRIAGRRGRYNIPNVGVFLWRVRSYSLTDSPAVAVDARRYLFNPLGANTPLYTFPLREHDITRLAGPANAPLPISRRALRARPADFYGPGRSFTIRVGNRAVDVDEIESCDLSDTDPSQPQTSAWTHMSQSRIAVDPVLGRIVFPADEARPVTVSYHYGGVADMGGGEYDRARTIDASLAPVVRVPADRARIARALADLGGRGAVQVAGSGRYAGPAAIAVAANRLLELRAANASRPLVALTGDLEIGGGDSGVVTLNGLLIAGGQLVVPAQIGGRPNRLQRLRLLHCTLVPGLELRRNGLSAASGPSLVVDASNVTVEIERCIVGALRVVEASRVQIADSIVDALAETAPVYCAPDDTSTGGALSVTSSTVIGKVHAASLAASNTIFLARLGALDTWPAPVIAARRQEGYVRYSYLPLEARTPPRYACRPADEEEALRVRPRFVSLRYGEAGYCQLHPACPREISRGAADEAEMGAYHDLLQPQRVDSLHARLDEYLRFGLEAGVFYAS